MFSETRRFLDRLRSLSFPWNLDLALDPGDFDLNLTIGAGRDPQRADLSHSHPRIKKGAPALPRIILQSWSLDLLASPLSLPHIRVASQQARRIRLHRIEQSSAKAATRRRSLHLGPAHGQPDESVWSKDIQAKANRRTFLAFSSTRSQPRHQAAAQARTYYASQRSRLNSAVGNIVNIIGS
ncbi:hypothetical protein N8I77_003364 [Diaporthe amygdali]|uniref:Uncharacterized protein n=1 Tax=Phomopsis amygdali TaxID=1214568 RepID=A0AAD9W4W7_PHOAM|nr:hypothetical protein N8I77_003364 [Diaporthe amygdali]